MAFQLAEATENMDAIRNMKSSTEGSRFHWGEGLRGGTVGSSLFDIVQVLLLLHKFSSLQTSLLCLDWTVI